MLSKKYRLSYLPLFYEDLDEKILNHIILSENADTPIIAFM